MILGKKAFENIAEKGENTGNQHFLLFPQCFLIFITEILQYWLPAFSFSTMFSNLCTRNIIILDPLELSSGNPLNLDLSKFILSS